MAANMAKALYYKGADVCIVTTSNESLPNEIHKIEVQSTQEMLEYINDSLRVAKKGKLSSATLMDNSSQQLIQKKPFFFGVAAVSDYIPKFPQDGKLKKDDIGESWNLELKQNIDILRSIDKSDIFTIGFKAETNQDVANTNAKNMLEKKDLDGVCLNIIDENNSFGSSSNNITYITKTTQKEFSGDKLEVSLQLLEYLKDTVE
jgi:phosphopantothenoylcysteine decarboxylase / phosphopantothenate---cysteine ligase